MASKYIVIKTNAGRVMDIHFNQPAGLPAGHRLDALSPVLENSHGVEGYWFSLDKALPHTGTATMQIQNYCNRLSADPANNICIVETDTPEDYGLIIEYPEDVV